jgi:hypothetical protein
MGSYFATPNPDVDSRKWLLSLERLMELDIEILVRLLSLTSARLTE